MNLIILCFHDQKFIRDLDKNLFDLMDSLDKTQDVFNYSNSLSAVMDSLSDKHLSVDQELLTQGWALEVQNEFEQLVAPLLQSPSHTENCIVSSAANAFFIDAWRSLCRRNDIPLRFVYVHRSEAFSDGNQCKSLSVREYNVALAMARQAGVDIACFDEQDWQIAPELAIQAVAQLVGRRDAVGLSLGASLAKIAAVSPRLTVTQIPIELEIIALLFQGKRFGRPLLLSAQAEEWLEQLERQLHPRGALTYWLRERRESIDESESLSLKSNIFSIPYAMSTEQIDKAWFKTLNEKNHRIRQLKIKLSENMAMTVKPRAVNNAVANKKIKNNAVTTRKILDKVENVSNSFRLWRKFKKDPHRFFSDSKSPILRRIRYLVPNKNIQNQF